MVTLGEYRKLIFSYSSQWLYDSPSHPASLSLVDKMVFPLPELQFVQASVEPVLRPTAASIGCLLSSDASYLCSAIINDPYFRKLQKRKVLVKVIC